MGLDTTGTQLMSSAPILVSLSFSWLSKHARWEELRSHVGLTGLLNRRGIIDTIDKSLSRPDASRTTLLVDIDNLKVINDMRGHATGDAVITLTAEAVREASARVMNVRGGRVPDFCPNCHTDEAAEIARRILDCPGSG
jgi:diguanylate cyclase (GGDEF)-like protein